jgi:hypothetical protein
MENLIPAAIHSPAAIPMSVRLNQPPMIALPVLIERRKQIMVIAQIAIATGQHNRQDLVEA